MYSGCEIDDDTPVASLDDEELFKRFKLRNDLRIKIPEFVHISMNACWKLSLRKSLDGI